MTTIEEPLVPIFMYHRYAVESTASMVGGQDFVYAMRGDGRTPVKWESAANQRKALEALAATLKPSELTVPKAVLDAIAPRPPGFGLHRELFPRTTGEGFDPLSPGTIAADVTIGFTLQADRAARMVAQNAVDPALPGLGEVIDRLTKATFDAPTASPYEAEVRRAAERVLVDRVTWLAMSAPERPGAGDRVAEAAASRRRGCAPPRPPRARPTRRSRRCSPPTSSASSSGPAPTRRRSCRRHRRRLGRRSATSARTGCRAPPRCVLGRRRPRRVAVLPAPDVAHRTLARRITASLLVLISCATSNGSPCWYLGRKSSTDSGPA